MLLKELSAIIWKEVATVILFSACIEILMPCVGPPLMRSINIELAVMLPALIRTSPITSVTKLVDTKSPKRIAFVADRVRALLALKSTAVSKPMLRSRPEEISSVEAVRPAPSRVIFPVEVFPCGRPGESQIGNENTSRDRLRAGR